MRSGMRKTGEKVLVTFFWEAVKVAAVAFKVDLSFKDDDKGNCGLWQYSPYVMET